jgi:sugar phosphate permease
MAFALGTAAFIPLFGLMYGIAGVIWGLVTDKKNGKVLAGFSATGAILNIALIAAPFIVIWAGIPD